MNLFQNLQIKRSTETEGNGIYRAGPVNETLEITYTGLTWWEHAIGLIAIGWLCWLFSMNDPLQVHLFFDGALGNVAAIALFVLFAFGYVWNALTKSTIFVSGSTLTATRTVPIGKRKTKVIDINDFDNFVVEKVTNPLLSFGMTRYFYEIQAHGKFGDRQALISFGTSERNAQRSAMTLIDWTSESS